MIKIAVLADDFTGALDTCVQFSTRGIQAVMYTDGRWKAAAEKEDSIVVLNLLTRHISPESACEKVRSAVLEMKRAGFGFVYLKTDSGLRGNIGAYLDGAIQAWGKGVLFAPSYPETGRIVRSGILYIDGVPVNESIFANDGLNPVRHAHVADIIHEQTKIDVFGDFRPEIPAVCLQDAADHQELLEIVNRGIRAGYTLFAGCAAFASALASAVVPEMKLKPPPRLSAPVVAISGSRSPITVQQFKIGIKCGFEAYAVQDILSDAPAIHPVLEAIRRNPDRGLLISVPEHLETVSMEPGLMGRRICYNLGRIAKGILDDGFHGTLLIVGGDTLSSVSSALRIVVIRPLSEIEPGVVVSQTTTADHEAFLMITKSGSFGSENLFPLILRKTEGCS